jgi:predicted transcriptional regulator
MKRTTIFVPESLERDLRLYATRTRRPAAAVVREALAEYLVRRQSASALPSFAGAFASGRSDTADRHEELLFKRLSPHRDGGRASRKPPKAKRRRS